MHYWGDEWFQKNGEDLYNAIDFVERELKKHHIGVCGKEKYGTYRDEYLRFWDGGLYQILFGYRLFHGPCIMSKRWQFMEKPLQWFHDFIYYVVDNGYTFGMLYRMHKNDDTKRQMDDLKKRFVKLDADGKEKWTYRGLCEFNRRIGLKKLVNDRQARQYNKTFQLAIKRWPNVAVELTCMTDGLKMIKPCKWGDFDAEAHAGWTTVNHE